MRTDRAARIILVGALLGSAPARADAPTPGTGGRMEAEPAWTPARFTIAVPAEVTVVGLTYGLRPEVLYRFGDGRAVGRLRLAVGVLDGPDQLFVPVSAGYRASFRQVARVRPAVGVGVELQHRLVSDFHAVRQYGLYVEGGLDVAIAPRWSIGAMVAIDVMLYGGPGVGLGPRLGVAWRL